MENEISGKHSKGFSKLTVFSRKIIELLSITPEEHLMSVDANDINEAYPLDPIEVKELLIGRSELLDNCLAHLSLQGRHLAVYGHRGIGKTSFSYVIQNFYENNTELFNQNIYKSCSKNTTLMDLFGELVLAEDKSYFEDSVVEKNRKTRSYGLNKILSFFIRKYREVQRSFTFKKGELTPAKIAESIHQQKTLMVIDELEKVGESNELCFELADLMKKLSDRKSNFKIIAVGISKSKDQLFRGHGSLTRQTNAVHMRPIEDLSDIFKIGQKKSGVAVKEDVRSKILKNSSGFPYFVKLQAFYSLKKAKKENLKVIDDNLYKRALIDLVGSEDEGVQKILMSIKKYEKELLIIPVLFAAAKIERFKFKVIDVQWKYEEQFDEILSRNKIEEILDMLSIEGNYEVLENDNDGMYCFKNIRDKIFLNIMSLAAINNNLNNIYQEIILLNRYLKKKKVKLRDREKFEDNFEKLKNCSKKECEKYIINIHKLIDDLDYIDKKNKSSIHSSISNFINSQM